MQELPDSRQAVFLSDVWRQAIMHRVGTHQYRNNCNSTSRAELPDGSVITERLWEDIYSGWGDKGDCAGFGAV